MLIKEYGLTHHNAEKSFPGLTLFAPIDHDEALLLNMGGESVHRWKLGKGGINHCMLLKNGNLFIGEGSGDGPGMRVGKGGMLREYDWDGNVVWEHHDEFQHHDARRLPNGNTL